MILNNNELVMKNHHILENEIWEKKSLRHKIIPQYFFTAVSMYLLFFLHLYIIVFGIYPVKIKYLTIGWIFIYHAVGIIGTTAGAHRLWSHRSYKAKLPLRILLMIMYASSVTHPLYYWIRDHRVHHKYTDTNADPHNIKRGFFFAHFGWLIMKRHPECLRRGREVNMSDILADPVVMFQKRHSTALRFIFAFIIPTLIPMIFWNEVILHAALSQCVVRVVVFVNFVSTINSFGHTWGYRPYNRSINAAENVLVDVLALGEGSHNYHHTFPWDYRASEFSCIFMNLTTFFIDTMVKLGWAYDLRKPSPRLVEKTICNIGWKSQ